jgi:hypothetical protein
MADVFGREQVPVGGVFISEKALMSISGAGDLGTAALVQNVSAQYQQQFQMLFELGSNTIYPIMGRPQGQLTIGRIVGGGGFSDDMFNACNGGATVSFQATQGACNGLEGSAVAATLHGVFVTNYGIEMNAQDLMVRENVQAVFTSMSKG